MSDKGEHLKQLGRSLIHFHSGTAQTIGAGADANINFNELQSGPNQVGSINGDADFVVNEQGVYQVCFDIFGSTAAGYLANEDIIVSIVKNGAGNFEQDNVYSAIFDSATAGAQTFNIKASGTVLRLENEDVIAVNVSNDSTGAYTLSGASLYVTQLAVL